jgi:hypothetical protein
MGSDELWLVWCAVLDQNMQRFLCDYIKFVTFDVYWCDGPECHILKYDNEPVDFTKKKWVLLEQLSNCERLKNLTPWNSLVD